MRRLILFRHAKSSWDAPSTDDHNRPLSARGERDAPRMAVRILTRGIGTGLLLASSARRTRQTAEALAAVAGAAVTVEYDPRLYLATPAAVLAVIAERNAAETDIIVIGHNPGLTSLANLLVPELSLDNLPTAGVIGMHLPIDDWTQIGTARGTLEFFDSPKSGAGT